MTQANPRPGLVQPMPSRAAFWALAPTWLALAWLVSKLRWVWSEQPEMQFGWIVLMLSGYLLWENWEQRPAPAAGVNYLGVASGIAAVSLLGLVQVYQAAFGTNAASLCGHGLATILVAAANLLLVFGPAGLHRFLFPFLFLMVAMPMPSAVQGPVTSHLQGLVATLNVETLNLFGIPAQRVGSLIQLSNGAVGVNEACSGIRSLQSSIMATLFIGYLSLRSLTFRALLLAGGVAAAVVGNVFRSLYLSFTAHARGVDSVNEVHDAAGWSILLFTATGVGVIAWYLSRVEKAALPPPPASPSP